MRSAIIFIPFACFLCSDALAQELRCDIKINTPKLQVADPAVFKTLESSIYEFMNNRKWTSDVFESLERIECQFVITITEEQGPDQFLAQATIVSNRPVFNSDYKTMLLNHSDKDWQFRYAQFQPLEFNEATHLSNLTSMLAFYAYIIIGLDYDSYGQDGGAPFYKKAQVIVDNAQDKNSVPEKGWKPYESNRNRYWLLENLQSSKYGTFRNSLYRYHAKGLDYMYQDRDMAAKVITGALNVMQQLQNSYPNTPIIQAFFSAKSDELVSIYQGAAAPEKIKAVNLLTKLDPANGNKYQTILKR